MYKCFNCDCNFQEPDIEETTYEHYYGISSLFSNSTSMSLNICPNCGSDDIEEIPPRIFTFYNGEGLTKHKFTKRNIPRL